MSGFAFSDSLTAVAMHTESSPHSATSQSKDLQNFLMFLSLQEQTSEMRNLKKAAEAGTQGRTRGLKEAQSWLCTQAERQHTRSRSAELQRAPFVDVVLPH